LSIRIIDCTPRCPCRFANSCSRIFPAMAACRAFGPALALSGFSGSTICVAPGTDAKRRLRCDHLLGSEFPPKALQLLHTRGRKTRLSAKSLETGSLLHNAGIFGWPHCL
jgi:hypothetical protein